MRAKQNNKASPQSTFRLRKGWQVERRHYLVCTAHHLNSVPCAINFTLLSAQNLLHSLEAMTSPTLSPSPSYLCLSSSSLFILTLLPPCLPPSPPLWREVSPQTSLSLPTREADHRDLGGRSQLISRTYSCLSTSGRNSTH